MSNSVIDKNGLIWYNRTGSGQIIEYMDSTSFPIGDLGLDTMPSGTKIISSGPVLGDDDFLYAIVRYTQITPNQHYIVKIDPDTRSIVDYSTAPEHLSSPSNNSCQGMAIHGRYLYTMYRTPGTLRKNDLLDGFKLVGETSFAKVTNLVQHDRITNRLTTDAEGNIYVMVIPRIYKFNSDLELLAVSASTRFMCPISEFQYEISEIENTLQAGKVLNTETLARNIRITDDNKLIIQAGTNFYSNMRTVNTFILGKSYSRFELDKDTLRFIKRTRVSPVRTNADGPSNVRLNAPTIGSESFSSVTTRQPLTPQFDKWKFITGRANTGNIVESPLEIMECNFFREDSMYRARAYPAISVSHALRLNTIQESALIRQSVGSSIPGSQDIIYTASNDAQYHIRAYDFSGNVLWTNNDFSILQPTTSEDLNGSPHLYGRRATSNVDCFSAVDGERLWTTSTGSTVVQIVVGKTQVLIPRPGGPLLSLDPYTGAQLWSRDFSADVGSFPGGTAWEDPDNGKIYVLYTGGTATFLYKLSPDGEIEDQVEIDNTTTNIGASSRIITIGQYLHHPDYANNEYVIRDKNTLAVIDNAQLTFGSNTFTSATTVQTCPQGVMWGGAAFIVKPDKAEFVLTVPQPGQGSTLARVRDNLQSASLSSFINGTVRILPD